MRMVIRILCLLLVTGLAVGQVQDTQAQILKRLKQRAEERLKDKVEEKANEEVDEAIDEAVEGAAEKAVEEGANEAGNAAGNAARGGAGTFQGQASAAPGGGGSTDGLTDFRELQSIFPAEVMGVKRTNLTGSKAGMLGFKSSTAEGTYGDDNGLEVKVTDMGGTSGIAAFSFAWLNTEVHNETDSGFERTTKFKEFPAFEKQEKSGDGVFSSIQIAIGGRFLISAESNVLGIDQVKQAMEAFDLAKLATIAGNDPGGAQPVEFALLKDLLPAGAAGLTRTESEGEKTEVLGMRMASSRGEYTDGKIGRVTLEITDSGNTGTALALSGPWAQQRDKTSDKGFERTLQYKGYPAFEQFNKEKDIPADYKPSNEMEETFSNGQFEVSVGKRFVVRASGYNVPFETIKALVDQVDLKKLESLAPAK